MKFLLLLFFFMLFSLFIFHIQLCLKQLPTQRLRDQVVLGTEPRPPAFKARAQSFLSPFVSFGATPRTVLSNADSHTSLLYI